MTDILRALADTSRTRVEESRKKVPLMEVANTAMKMNLDTGFPFERMLSRPGMQFICECKKASPSKGLISKYFPYVEIAKEYEQAGAAAVSVLTEPTRFLGSIDYLREVSAAVSIPVLRKDFVVDEYMIYEAKVNGASACLLIVSLLTKDELSFFIKICHLLGMSALVECHDAGEVNIALECGARVIGVNNRNLHDFTVSLNNSLVLRRNVPANVLYVAESGINDRYDVAVLEDAGVDAVLVGESLMRSPDKVRRLAELRGE